MFIPYAALGVAVGCAALGGVLASPVFAGKLRLLRNRSQRYERMLGTRGARSALFEGLLRNGVAMLRPVSGLLLQSQALRLWLMKIVKALEIKGYTSKPDRAAEVILLAAASLALVAFLVTGNLVITVAVPTVLMVVLIGRAQKELVRWEDKLGEQVPEAIRALGICFNAGYSLQQAFEQTAQDIPDPLGAELRQTSVDISAGKSIEEALRGLEKRTNLTDLQFVIVALEIQHRSGGSLQDLLDSAADSVVASADLRRQLKIQTAQARLSAKVVTVLPLILMGLLSLSMEGYLQTFFSSSTGLMIFLVAVGMEALGVFMVRRILGVDLG